MTTPVLNALKTVHESRRKIPVVAEVDVVVVGGTTWGVAAALAACEAGATVYLIASRSYLGEDMCSTLRLELADGQSPPSRLARAIFPEESRHATPLRVKQVLDRELLTAGVSFIFGSFVTDILTDANNQPCGVVMANRAGRQAVVGKIVIDATSRASVARLAGAEAGGWPADPVVFERTVIMPAEGNGQRPRFVTHRIPLTLPDGSYPSLAQAEQHARDQTYVEGQLRSSELLFFLPPDPIVCRQDADGWQGVTDCSLDHFQPRGIDRLWVLSGCADIPRDEAARLLQPAGLMGLAERIGQRVALDARALPSPMAPCLASSTRLGHGDPASNTSDRTQPSRGDEPSTGDSSIASDSVIHENLNGLRPSDDPTRFIESHGRNVEILGRWDVIVAGGGTAGAAAAIAAAREGRRVLVIEYQEALGGIGTVGLITNPYHGLKIGFAKDVPFRVEAHGPEIKMQWLRRQLLDAGGEIWLGCASVGTYCVGSTACGVVVATPEKRGIVVGDVIIDATGNADLAIAAGSPYFACATENGELAVQGVGLPHRPLNKGYVNTDYVLTDDSDLVDCWATFVGTRLALGDDMFDTGSMIQSRERRRIVGEHVMTYLDQIVGRTYPDSVVLAASDYDSHGYPSGRYFALIPHDDESRTWNHPAPGGPSYTPYRCLLPQKIEGMLVVGLGISIERDASALVRMQLDMLNQGYAAGLAASMSSQAGIGPRHVDIRALQRRLIQLNALPEEVLTQSDNLPFDEARIAQAVRDMSCNHTADKADRTFASIDHPGRSLAAPYIEKMRSRPAYDTACRALAMVLAHPQAATPMLRQAWEQAKGDARLLYARVLCMIGYPTGVNELVGSLREATWDAKILQGKMAEYAHLYTPVDSTVLALGASGDREALPALIEKLEQLDADATLSHHRAMAVALEQMRDPAAAEPLAKLLQKPGMSGHVMLKVEPMFNNPVPKRRREGALRELMLARALLRCGDYEGLAQGIIQQYRSDLRGLLAQHAKSLLAST